MQIRVAGGLVFGAVVAAGFSYWLSTLSHSLSSDANDFSAEVAAVDDDEWDHPTAGLREGLVSDEIKGPVAPLREYADAPAGDHGHSIIEDPTGDLGLYERVPMSDVPHHVVRGWGARGSGKLPGVVGAYVIVDPAITDDTLERLARDIRIYHLDADAVSVRILDSEQAAIYDRHSDGGELAAAHLVGSLSRNSSLGIDRIEIRGTRFDTDN